VGLVSTKALKLNGFLIALLKKICGVTNMLSGKLLKELIERSWIRDELIELAWPSLDTVSKLQLISELQDGGNVQLSDKLLSLAGNDSEAIVRFWASRFSVVPHILSDADRKSCKSDNDNSRLLDHSEEAIATARKLQDDEASMVRDMASLNIRFWDGPEEPLNPHQRLLAARYFGRESISSMMKWALGLWKQKTISEDETSQIVGEILRSPRMKEEFLDDELSRDGMTHFSNVANAKEIWRMSSELPKRSAREIGYYAPIRVEKSNILADIFEEIPAVTQASAASRLDGSLDEVLERVRANPENYDDEVVKQVEIADRYASEMPSSEEIEQLRMLKATDREQALVEITMALARQLRDMREEIALLTNRQSKGIWRR
jgi:hypothetical protein